MRTFRVGVSFLWTVLLAGAVLLPCRAGNVANPDAVELKPLPVPVVFESDMDRPIRFDASLRIRLSVADPGARTASADWLARRLADWFPVSVPTVETAEDAKAVNGGDEAYAVAADGDGVRIDANTIKGVRYALYTIRQLAIARRGTRTVEGYLLPRLKIEDHPALSFRALHLCWFPETTAKQVERSVRLAALLKYNHVIIETWGTYESARYPWWGWADEKVMSKKSIRRLVEIGRELGVTLVPQLNAFGHATLAGTGSLKHAVLDLHPEYEPLFEPGGWNWCLTNPEAGKVLRGLIDEMHEDFGRPPFFHIGCDEAQPPSCPECRRGAYADKVTAHIRFLADVLERRGARAMIWHDMFLQEGDPRWKEDYANGSAAMAAKIADLPRSVVICDWNYRPPRQNGEYPSFRYFKDMGFDVLTCPYDEVKTIDAQAKAARKEGIFGFLGTTWLYPEGVAFSKLVTHDAFAAWGGTADEYEKPWNSRFLTLLRHVGWDMNVRDRTLTGVYRYQYHPYGGTKDSK